MAFGFICLVITLFALAGVIRELRKRNFFASGYAFISMLVFGWFSIMTLYAAFFGSGAMSGQ